MVLILKIRKIFVTIIFLKKTVIFCEKGLGVFSLYSILDKMDTKKTPTFYRCEKCDFTCCKNSEWERHITRPKHFGIQKEYKKTPTENVTLYSCVNCNKLYKYHSGLWKHNKTCTTPIGVSIHKSDSNGNNNEISIFKNLMLEVVKSNSELQKKQCELQEQNNELQKKIIEVCQTNSSIVTNNNHSNNTINSNNKTFNLMFFLNEQCKDAMNMSEFVDSFELKLEDLESVGKLGYVEGITKIFVDKLNSMDVHKRPIHCSDAKREIIYIKDDNRWEREVRSNPKLRRAIKIITFKNMKLAPLWSDTYPDSKSSESSLNDVYMKIIIQSTGGSGEISNNEDKIIRRIAKEIIIEKK
jgi:hypothetical protein